MSDSCSTCKFAFNMSPDAKQKALVCRRFPPFAHLLMRRTIPTPSNPNGEMSATAQAVPPPVQPDWCCGEFVKGV